jgi:hypothetical protein
MKAVKVLVVLTICVLTVGCFGMGMIAIINPECFFLGAKLGGEPARAYLIANILVGIACIYLLLRAPIKGAILSILYSGYNIAQVELSPFHTLSPLYISGLVSAIALLVLILVSQRRRRVKLK